ncbi:MAG: hypothetical protein ACRDSR_26955, partial [Pseudonocardiaceae bacterium]
MRGHGENTALRVLLDEAGMTNAGLGRAVEEPYDGLTCCGTLEGTVCTIVELSGQDMRRRKLLLGSVFSAAAFAEPALFALTV